MAIILKGRTTNLKPIDGNLAEYTLIQSLNAKSKKKLIPMRIYFEYKTNCDFA